MFPLHYFLLPLMDYLPLMVHVYELQHEKLYWVYMHLLFDLFLIYLLLTQLLPSYLIVELYNLIHFEDHMHYFHIYLVLKVTLD